VVQQLSKKMAAASRSKIANSISSLHWLDGCSVEMLSFK